MNPPDPAAAEIVVLVHGLWTGPWVMAFHAGRLRRRGFRVERYAYDSMGQGLAEAAAGLARFAAALDGRRVHFVGHSLGGLVILAMPPGSAGNEGRIVLLGSPYADSVAARRLEATGWGRRLLGRTLRDWRAGEKPGLDGRQVGVLAGRRGIGLGRLVARLPVPNDGVVAEAETRVPGMADFVSVPVSHTEMLWSRQVTGQVCAFLRRGRFEAGEDAA